MAAVRDIFYSRLAFVNTDKLTGLSMLSLSNFNPGVKKKVI